MTQPLEVDPSHLEYERTQWELYIAVIEPDVSSVSRAGIQLAYNFAQDAHRGQLRVSGERYFEHPRAVSLVLLEAGVTDANLHIVALLHDVPEDSFEFIHNTVAQLPREAVDDWTRLAMLFYDQRIADMTAVLTEPFGFDKEEVEQEYYDQLEEALDYFPEVLLVKMADRVHNLRTLDAMSSENQKAKIKETIEVYFPLFEQVVTKFPKAAGYMLEEMKKAITALGYSL